VRFGNVDINEHDGSYEYDVIVHLGGIPPQHARLELYADPRGSERPFRSAMSIDAVRLRSQECNDIPALPQGDRSMSGYTPHVVAYLPDGLVSLELPLDPKPRTRTNRK
jgi:hypothetical protein